jgi:AGCS family alanine or glycine:cation symporter
LRIISLISEWLWGPATCAIFLCVGLLLTIRTGFFQFLHVKNWLVGTVSSLFSQKMGDKQKGFSAMQSLSTALAATIGTGNIVGVATAMVSGGPGAIFWMWVAALLGMMTKYAEVLLSVYYRKKGLYRSGPMYVLEHGLKCKPLAVFYAFFCLAASFGIGNMSQGNSIASAVNATWNVPPALTGFVVMILAAFILIGGVKRLGAVTEKLIPFMAGFYLFFSVVVLFMQRHEIPNAFITIFNEAFRFESVGGGALGYTAMQAVRYGVARGIFTNEAGLGTSSMAHAASTEVRPVKQAMMGIFEVFVDTIVICTVTALVILTTGVLDCGLNGAELTICAFSQNLGGFAQIFISISIMLFAFASILCWCFYGEQCAEYLWGTRAIKAYRFIYIVFIWIGCVLSMEAVWNICDIFNMLMAIPNLSGVVMLSGQVKKITREYFQHA